jgi:hypothetical protein
MIAQPTIPEIWFFKPRGIVGYAVTLWTRGTYSHCGIAHSIAGVPVFSDSSNVKGCACRTRQLEESPDLIVPFPIDQGWLTATIARMYGRPYGWLDVIGFVDGHAPDYSGLICTDFILCVLIAAVNDGFKIPGGAAALALPKTKTSPDALLSAVK